MIEISCLLPYLDKIWKHDLSMMLPTIKRQLSPGLPGSAPEHMSPEFFNILFAFKAIALRYPCVFWQANHSFSFLFSFILSLVGLQSIIEASTASVLVKLCWNRLSPDTRLVGLCSFQDPQHSVDQTTTATPSVEPLAFDSITEDKEGLRNMTALILSVGSSLLMICLSMTVFEYGINHFTYKISAFNNNNNNNTYSLHRNAVLDRSTSPPLEVTSDATSSQGGWGGCKGSSEYPQSSGGFSKSFICHVIAITGSLCVLAIKMPIVIACIQLYQERKESLMLVNVIITIILFCFWFISWFAFCLKPTWECKVSHL